MAQAATPMPDRSGLADTPPALPMWVKAGMVIAALLVLAVVALLLFGPDGHGPARHS